MKRWLTVAFLSMGWLAGAAFAQGAKVSDGVVKIGLILDMNSLYADLTGEGSVAAFMRPSGRTSRNRQSAPGDLLLPLSPTAPIHRCGGSIHPGEACAQRACPAKVGILLATQS